MEELITINLSENINLIKQQFGDSSDLSVRRFKLSDNSKLIAIVYINSMIDENKLRNFTLEFNNLNTTHKFNSPNISESCFEHLKNSISSSSEISESSDIETLYNQILSGKTIILVDGYNKFLSFNTYGVESRSIEEPTTQTVVKGPKEGFTEKISVNISQIRRRIKDKSLRVENQIIGNITKTTVSVMYIDKLAKSEIINEVKLRLNQINIDGILDIGYIEELIKDDRYSLFPTFLSCEKPDTVAAGLLEGRIAILVDGTPYVLVVPAFFSDFFQASEDYYNHFIISSVNRFIREMAFFLTLFVPSIYIALSTFQQELIPTPLLVSIAAQREGVPFPVFLEVLIMEITFEIMREAGIRMPRAIGPAVTIVGALVLGEAAVQAGFISAIMVIVVSITAISNFVIPYNSMSDATRIIRFVFMLISAIYGMYGICFGMIVMILHISKLKSIGIPYFAPFAPKLSGEKKDFFIRKPIWKKN